MSSDLSTASDHFKWKSSWDLYLNLRSGTHFDFGLQFTMTHFQVMEEKKHFYTSYKIQSTPPSSTTDTLIHKATGLPITFLQGGWLQTSSDLCWLQLSWQSTWTWLLQSECQFWGWAEWLMLSAQGHRSLRHTWSEILSTSHSITQITATSPHFCPSPARGIPVCWPETLLPSFPLNSTPMIFFPIQDTINIKLLERNDGEKTDNVCSIFLYMKSHNGWACCMRDWSNEMPSFLSVKKYTNTHRYKPSGCKVKHLLIKYTDTIIGKSKEFQIPL